MSDPLWPPMHCSPPGSFVPGIFQARILECVAMPFSRGSSQPWDWTCVSYVSCTDRGFFTTDITWEAYSIGFTNSLIFTIYGMARQSIISSVLDRSHYNAWSKKEVWLLDIHPMFLQQHLRGHLYGSPTTGLTSLCVLCNTSFDWPGGNV